MVTQNFRAYLKGDTFKARKVTMNIDITDIDIRIQFRQGSKTGDLMQEAVITKINANQFTIGSFLLDWEADLTYFYDAQFTYLNDTVITYFGGSFPIVQDVTQPIV